MAGESYGGIIIPQVALRIEERNAAMNENGFKWKLKGIILGNPLIDYENDGTPSFVDAMIENKVFPDSLY